MIRTLFGITVLFFLLSCSDQNDRKNKKETAGYEEAVQLTLEQANILIELPLACLQTEYPNKLGQTLGKKEDLGEPHDLHPAFYGCFDWHSSVHGHWSLVKVLKRFPDIEKAESAKQKLKENITKEKISAELDYFKGKHSKSYERTYGWAWLLKLAEELHTWDDPLARELEQNLQPLTDLVAERYIKFLPNLVYPIRIGEHENTAFGLSFAWDYANTVNHTNLINSIELRARDYYLSDENCPLNWEPGGYDFLSPCLEEIDIMRRILNENEFRIWIKKFSPQLISEDFNLAVGEVHDREDGKLVHLDGLKFRIAWVLYRLEKQYPEYRHLIKTANEHVKYSLLNLISDTYEGGHWLGSFAVYALDVNFTE